MMFRKSKVRGRKVETEVRAPEPRLFDLSTLRL
jgi:hypothetical protein